MDQDKKNLLVFGYGLGGILLVLSGWGAVRGGFGVLQGLQLLGAIGFLGVTAAYPPALHPVYKGWMRIAHCIGGIMTTGILSVMFFGVFAPIGFFFRLFEKDHLDRKIDKAATTYWIPRSDEISSREHYERQF